jgi:ATP-dependent Clp protease ATP-binding subunit ClpC
MFERFTERARQVIVLAQDEARGMKTNYIGTEHILLGLLREDDGVAARVLRDFGIEVEATRAWVYRRIGPGAELITGQLPFTPRSKKVIELSLREALSLGHNYIGTEHILLGLIREGGGLATEYLDEVGLPASTIRSGIIRFLNKASNRELTPTERQRRAIKDIQSGIRQIEEGIKALEAGLVD